MLVIVILGNALPSIPTVPTQGDFMGMLALPPLIICLVISALMVQSRLGFRLLLPALLFGSLCGCSDPQPPATQLQPLPGMTRLREDLGCGPAIDLAALDLIAVLKPAFKHVNIERLKVPETIDWETLAARYREQLPADWQASPYPKDHALYQLASWGSGGWSPRYLALALLNENGCPEKLPFKIALIAVPEK